MFLLQLFLLVKKKKRNCNNYSISKLIKRVNTCVQNLSEQQISPETSRSIANYKYFNSIQYQVCFVDKLLNWICIFWESSSMKNLTGKQQKDYSPSCPSPVCWPMLPSCRWLVCLSHPQLQTDYRTSRTSSLRTKKGKSNYQAVPQPAIFIQKECKTVVFNFNGLGKTTLFLSLEIGFQTMYCHQHPQDIFLSFNYEI